MEVKMHIHRCKRSYKMHLRFDNVRQAEPKQLHGSRMPPMLLLPISLVRLRQLTLALHCKQFSIQIQFTTQMNHAVSETRNKRFHTSTSLRKINFHPFRWARTAMSMSSTVVLSSHPPESSNALILHTPAVPLNPKKLINTPLTCCSTSKWKQRLMFWSLVSKFSSLLTKDHLA